MATVVKLVVDWCPCRCQWRSPSTSESAVEVPTEGLIFNSSNTLTVSDQSFAEVFVEYVCAHRYPLLLVFGFCLTLIMLMFLSLLAAERGSATYVISVVNLVGLGSITIVLGLLLRKCREIP